MTVTTRKRKVISAVAAVAVSAAILLTGTFAWQSVSQTALNEKTGTVNPGARLHDDFDGTNKDVYVENFMSEAEGGVPINAREVFHKHVLVSCLLSILTNREKAAWRFSPASGWTSTWKSVWAQG